MYELMYVHDTCVITYCFSTQWKVSFHYWFSCRLIYLLIYGWIYPLYCIGIWDLVFAMSSYLLLLIFFVYIVMLFTFVLVIFFTSVLVYQNLRFYYHPCSRFITHSKCANQRYCFLISILMSFSSYITCFKDS